MTDRPYGEVLDEMDHEAKYLPAENILADVITTMRHARVFIASREKMHPTGIELYDELLAKLERRETPVSGNVRAALEAVQQWDENDSNPASYGGLPDRIRKVVDDALRLAAKDEAEPEKLRLFLAILESAGGETNASDHKWNWINYFCDDAEPLDTFNQASERKLTRVTHDSDSDYSEVFLTQAGRDYLATPPTAAQDEAREFTPFDAWRELVNKDDRTSPEDYPEMCLIEEAELADFMTRGHSPTPDEARERVIEALPPCGYGLMPDPEVALTYASILLKPKRCVDGVRRGPGEIEKAAAMALQLYARRVANAEERDALSPSNPRRMQGGEAERAADGNSYRYHATGLPAGGDRESQS